MSIREYELKWLSDIENEFMNKFGKSPDLLSDWDPDIDTCLFPYHFVQDSLKFDQGLFKYHFLHSLNYIKELAVNYFNNLNIYFEDISENNIALGSSVTNALFMILLSFKRKNLNKGLAVRPIYYSVRSTCDDLGIKLDTINSFSDENYLADIDEITHSLKTGNYDFLILTNPVYCVGMLLPIQYIHEIQEQCIKNRTLLIIDEAFMMPWFDDLPEYNRYSVSDTIVIRSFAKRLFINGLKAATIIGPKWLIQDIEMISTYVIGGITYPQLQLTTTFFSGSDRLIEEIEQCKLHNQILLRDNYLSIKKLLEKFPFSHLMGANSSPYAMIDIDIIENVEDTVKQAMKLVLFETGCLIMPSWRFSFTIKNNPFSFRINLSRSNLCYLDSIDNVLSIIAEIGCK